MNNILSFLPIWNAYVKIGVSRSLAYRSSFIAYSLVQTGWTIFNLIFLGLLVQVNSNIAGWQSNELFLVASIFTILDAFTWSLMYPNIRDFTEEVFNGSIVSLLLKPTNAYIHSMFRRINLNGIFRLLIGIIMLIVSIRSLGTVNFWQVLNFLFMAGVSFMFIYILWFSVATISFWVERLNNINEIVPSLREFFRFPRQIFPPTLSFILTFVLPLGLVTTLPSEILLHRASVFHEIYFIAFTLILFKISKWFFFFSLKKYNIPSS